MLVKEFIDEAGLNTQGKTIKREAVRAIILDQNKILLVHSNQNEDYKFPGGGIIPGEGHHGALVREVREECGVTLTKMGDLFAITVEFKKPKEAGYDVFKQVSHYYICRADFVFRGQDLDQYEQELGLRPVWLEVSQALHRNRLMLESKSGVKPRWLQRETYMLKAVLEHLG